jgi:hypothetical protein
MAGLRTGVAKYSEITQIPNSCTVHVAVDMQRREWTASCCTTLTVSQVTKPIHQPLQAQILNLRPETDVGPEQVQTEVSPQAAMSQSYHSRPQMYLQT